MEKYIEKLIIKYLEREDPKKEIEITEEFLDTVLEGVVNYLELEVDELIYKRIKHEVETYRDYYIDTKIRELKLSLFGKDLMTLEIKADVMQYYNTNQYYKFVDGKWDEIAELEYLTALENADTSFS